MKKITTIIINGMHCPSCKLLLEDVCSEVPNVQKCDVDFMNGTAELEYEEPLDFGLLKSKIEGMGKYSVELPAI